MCSPRIWWPMHWWVCHVRLASPTGTTRMHKRARHLRTQPLWMWFGLCPKDAITIGIICQRLSSFLDNNWLDSWRTMQKGDKIFRFYKFSNFFRILVWMNQNAVVHQKVHWLFSIPWTSNVVQIIQLNRMGCAKEVL